MTLKGTRMDEENNLEQYKPEELCFIFTFSNESVSKKRYYAQPMCTWKCVSHLFDFYFTKAAALCLLLWRCREVEYKVQELVVCKSNLEVTELLCIYWL